MKQRVVALELLIDEREKELLELQKKKEAIAIEIQQEMAEPATTGWSDFIRLRRLLNLVLEEMCHGKRKQNT